MTKKYEYRTTVTIGDTNLLQNVYFANFFKIQGIVRELWFNEEIDPGYCCFNKGLIVITKSASCNYIKDFYLSDKIVVRLHVTKLGNASAELKFRFYKEDTMELHAEGCQTLVFADVNHKICRIPEEIKTLAYEYMAKEKTDGM